MRLDHPDIELAHVKLAWDDTGISLVDNGSRKGTWLKPSNGRKRGLGSFQVLAGPKRS
jgi:hypothetical protein